MKVLFTNGTTKFIEPLYWLNSLKDHKVLQNLEVQCYDYNNETPELNVVKFITDLDYNNYDLIISHAGAGSIYSVLELRRPLIVIPDMIRIDKHQTEMARFVTESNYAEVAYNCYDLKLLLNKFMNTGFNNNLYYNKTSFEISEFISLL